MRGPPYFRQAGDGPAMRMRVAAALTALVLLPLAGCLDDVADDDGDGGGRPVPGRIVPPLAWPAVLAGPGADAESSLAVSPDGQTVLACAHGGFTQASPLWASTDGGATFRRADPPINQPFDGDCDVAITDDGTWHIVYDTIASATFASSPDQGATWWVHPFTAEPFGGVDRPWILAVGNDVVLVWADVMAALPFLSFHTRTSDHGRTWSPHTVMGTFTPSEVNCFLAHPILTPDGALQVPIACKDGDEVLGAGPLFLLESTDEGLTWDRIPTGVRSGGAISASYAGDGGLWMTVNEQEAKGNRHGVVHSLDQGRSFTEPLWLDSNVTAGFGWFWVDGRPDGSATTAWMDAHEDETWQVAAARVGLDGEQPVLQALGHVGPVGEETIYEFFMVRHDASGRAFISFPQNTGPDCHRAGPLSPPGDASRNAQCLYIVVEPVLDEA